MRFGFSESEYRFFRARFVEDAANPYDVLKLSPSASNEEIKAQYRKLVACGVSRDDIRKYVKLVLELEDNEEKLSARQRNILDNVVALALTGVGNDGRTAWSAYNGVTQYLTHEYGRNADSRLRANWYGEAKRVNDRALTLALQLAS